MPKLIESMDTETWQELNRKTKGDLQTLGIGKDSILSFRDDYPELTIFTKKTTLTYYKNLKTLHDISTNGVGNLILMFLY